MFLIGCFQHRLLLYFLFFCLLCNDVWIWISDFSIFDRQLGGGEWIECGVSFGLLKLSPHVNYVKLFIVRSDVNRMLDTFVRATICSSERSILWILIFILCILIFVEQNNNKNRVSLLHCSIQYTLGTRWSTHSMASLFVRIYIYILRKSECKEYK